ncbi:MAG: capsid cement protein [Thermoguttaceae bacterium]
MTAYAQYAAQALFRYPYGQIHHLAASGDFASGGNTYPANDGDVLQLADGRIAIIAGVGGGADAAQSGDMLSVYTLGVFQFVCPSATTFSDGAKAYWDPVALTIVTTGGNGNGSFYAGLVIGAKVAGALSVLVDINVPAGALSAAALDATATITATGTTVATAAPLTSKLNFVNNGTASTGIAVSLPAPVAGLAITVVNSWGTSINVFASNTTIKIDNAANTAVAVAGYGTSVFRSDGTAWYSQTATA